MQKLVSLLKIHRKILDLPVKCRTNVINCCLNSVLKKIFLENIQKYKNIYGEKFAAAWIRVEHSREINDIFNL